MNSPDKDQAGAAQSSVSSGQVDPVVVTAKGTGNPAVAPGDTVSIARISPLSALKVGAGFAVTLFLVWMVAVAIVWFGLQQAGVWDRLNNLLADLFGLNSFSAGLFFGLAAVLGALEVLVIVLLAPLAAVVYNNAERLFGGLKIELKSIKK